MVLLILRLFPYLAAIIFFILGKTVFYWPDYWLWFFIALLLLPGVYFSLIRIKRKTKPVIATYLYSLLFTVAGFAFLLILENIYVINFFLLIWSFLFGLYLEAVFHDFYETDKVHIVNLNNLSLYFNILIVFFLTASLVNFSIFLNWSMVAIVCLLGLVYFFLYYWLYLKHLPERRQALIYALIQAIVLTELLFLLLIWPVSFYVIAILAAAIYYLMLSLTLSHIQDGNKRNAVLRTIIIFVLVVILTLISAIWL
ncbi:MAG: hypothetical protein WCT16_04070 [Candidatus Buchananbacteria bacterium]